MTRGGVTATPGRPQLVIVATRNAGKVRELTPILTAAGLVAVTLSDAGITLEGDEEAIECFDTFEENALAKARYYSLRASGALVLADDSGLSVDALGGAPGVHSKRWAADTREGTADGHVRDSANNAKLVRELATAVRADLRTARYVCVAAMASGGARVVEVTARGECAGRILERPSGDGGFGYDPYFLSDELGVSFGMASIDAKEAISHRGRAVRAVLQRFAEDFARNR